MGEGRWSGLVRRRNIWFATVAFGLGVIGALAWLREPMQPLTRATLEAARQRWRDGGIRTYQVRYQMNGSLCEIRCRDGIVEMLTVDGRPSNTADVRSYSIGGLLDLLDLELENLHDPQGPFGERASSMMARVRFNPQLGYPERYIRSGGMGRGASIVVISFEAK